MPIPPTYSAYTILESSMILLLPEMTSTYGHQTRFIIFVGVSDAILHQGIYDGKSHERI